MTDKKEHEKDVEVIYVEDLIIEGLMTDGEHHKQWYLEEILRRLGGDPDELGHDPGVAP